MKHNYHKKKTHKSSYTVQEQDYDEEELNEYRKGGYHPVAIGNKFKSGRYHVLEKLGWGYFSTVWLCRDLQNQINVALKIVKSDKDYRAAAYDEIEILQKINLNDPNNENFVIHLFDHFEHAGPNGNHVVMSMEPLGNNLLDLIKYYDYTGIPTKIVRIICRQILIGLDYLHSTCGIIHADLKPENILLAASVPTKKIEPNKSVYHSIPEYKETDPSTFLTKIADFGNACWVDKHFTDNIQTRQYRSPEAILGIEYNTTTDMWSMGCIVFELLTGDMLFTPKNGVRFDKNDHHLSQMISLLGPLPKNISLGGKYSRDFFKNNGELKYIHNINFKSIDKILIEKYNFSKEAAAEIASFILPMLNYCPNSRVSAKQMLDHPWVN